MEENKINKLSHIGLLTVIIREQNLILLNKIADRMELTKLRREEFIDKYHKVSYWYPKVTLSKKRENLQKRIANSK